jgi:hypothetical protein
MGRFLPRLFWVENGHWTLRSARLEKPIDFSHPVSDWDDADGALPPAIVRQDYHPLGSAERMENAMVSFFDRVQLRSHRVELCDGSPQVRWHFEESRLRIVQLGLENGGLGERA